MSDTATAQLQELLRRMNAGDPTVRDELIARAYDRMRRLTRKMLQDFSRVHRWEETDDVLHEALLRLLRALQKVPLASPEQFFRLAATQVRRELQDLTRHYFGPQGAGANHASDVASAGSDGGPQPGYDRSTSTFEPSQLLAWSEFHQQVDGLPEEQRAAFELCWYQGLTQAEAALLLNVSETTVKRHWLAARARLGGFLRRHET
jgi:RNA polymerase sigma-70 factor (ECF subfamily)